MHVALTGMLIERPDLVVSGINNGPNMGDDTLYSGTVAAATEGYLFGIPAIAFSQSQFGWANLDAAARVAREIVERQFDALQKPYLLNVNIPAIPYEQMQGVVATRLGKRHSAEPVIRALDPVAVKSSGSVLPARPRKAVRARTSMPLSMDKYRSRRCRST